MKIWQAIKNEFKLTGVETNQIKSLAGVLSFCATLVNFFYTGKFNFSEVLKNALHAQVQRF